MHRFMKFYADLRHSFANKGHRLATIVMFAKILLFVILYRKQLLTLTVLLNLWHFIQDDLWNLPELS